jgi:hypothetical protein
LIDLVIVHLFNNALSTEVCSIEGLVVYECSFGKDLEASGCGLF